jgi:hypothetical protein
MVADYVFMGLQEAVKCMQLPIGLCSRLMMSTAL